MNARDKTGREGGEKGRLIDWLLGFLLAKAFNLSICYHLDYRYTTRRASSVIDPDSIPMIQFNLIQEKEENNTDPIQHQGSRQRKYGVLLNEKRKLKRFVTVVDFVSKVVIVISKVEDELNIDVLLFVFVPICAFLSDSQYAIWCSEDD